MLKTGVRPEALGKIANAGKQQVSASSSRTAGTIGWHCTSLAFRRGRCKLIFILIKILVVSRLACLALLEEFSVSKIDLTKIRKL